MTEEHILIKKMFEWLIENPKSEHHGFHNTGGYFDNDEGEYVLYHSDGHRVEFKKEGVCDPHEEGFKWSDYQLNPNDFDKDGYQYEFSSWHDADGFKDVSIEELQKKLGCQ